MESGQGSTSTIRILNLQMFDRVGVTFRGIRRPPQLSGFTSLPTQGSLSALFRRFIAIIALPIWIIVFTTSAMADTARISLELNQLQTINDRCRMTLLSSNHLESDLERLTIELVLLNPEGQVLRFMRIALPTLRAERSRAQIFEAKDITCDRIATMLLNNIVECHIQDVEGQTCADIVSPSSRTNVRFVTFLGTPSEQSAD